MEPVLTFCLRGPPYSSSASRWLSTSKNHWPHLSSSSPSSSLPSSSSFSSLSLSSSSFRCRRHPRFPPCRCLRHHFVAVVVVAVVILVFLLVVAFVIISLPSSSSFSSLSLSSSSFRCRRHPRFPPCRCLRHYHFITYLSQWLKVVQKMGQCTQNFNSEIKIFWIQWKNK